MDQSRRWGVVPPADCKASHMNVREIMVDDVEVEIFNFVEVEWSVSMGNKMVILGSKVQFPGDAFG